MISHVYLRITKSQKNQQTYITPVGGGRIGCQKDENYISDSLNQGKRLMFDFTVFHYIAVFMAVVSDRNTCMLIIY